jgi:PAS domain S-box-containing protein
MARVPLSEPPARFPVSLTLVFLVCVAITGLATVGLLAAGAAVARSAHDVQHALQVQRAIETLQATLLDAETGQRGFLLTGREHFLAPYIDAVTRHAHYIGSLEELVRQNPQQLQTLQELKPLVAEQLQQLATTMTAFRDPARAAGEALLALDRGKQLMDRVRIGLEAMRLEEQRVLAAGQADVDQRGQRAIVLLFVASIAGVLGLTVLYGAMRRYHARREEVQGALDRSEEAYQGLFESSAIGLAQCDARSSRFLRVNPRLCEITGHAPEELARTTLIDLLPRDARLDNARALRELVAGTRPVVDLEQPARRKDGSTFWASVRVAAMHGSEGGTPRIAVFLDDVTERRNVAEALGRNHALLQAVTQSTQDLVYAKDVEGRMLLANDALLHMVGKPREEVIGSRDVDLVADSDAAAAMRANDLRVIGERKPMTVEETFPLAEGRRTFLGTRAPILDASGNVIGTVGIATDITARKRSEADLRSTHAQLANPLSAVWRDVLAAMDALRDRAPELDDCRQRALDALVDARDRLRAVMDGLRPVRLDQGGLVRALEVLVRDFGSRTGIRAIFVAPQGWRELDHEIEVVLLWLAEEALANVARNASASTVHVHLALGAEAASLSVRDDGLDIGSSASGRADASGIAGMHERLRACGGTLAIGRGPEDRGSVLMTTLPLTVRADARSGTA